MPISGRNCHAVVANKLAAYHTGMLPGKDDILIRIALLKQQEREMLEKFKQPNLSEKQTEHLEAMLVAVSAEIVVLESMIHQ
jgi:hypothetical protein